MAASAVPIEFEVDGEVYPVAFTVNALCSLEEMFSATITQVGELVSSGKAGVRGVLALFRASLLEGHPEITPVETGRLIAELGQARSTELVQDAFNRLKEGLVAKVTLPPVDGRGRLTLDTAGVRLTLSFNINAQAEMEAYFHGMKPEEILARMSDEGVGIRDIRAMFRAALLDDKEVTLEDAGRLMDRIGIRLSAEAVRLAFPASFPEKEPGEEDDGAGGHGNRRDRRAAAAGAGRSPTSRRKAVGTGQGPS